MGEVEETQKDSEMPEEPHAFQPTSPLRTCSQHWLPDMQTNETPADISCWLIHQRLWTSQGRDKLSLLYPALAPEPQTEWALNTTKSLGNTFHSQNNWNPQFSGTLYLGFTDDAEQVLYVTSQHGEFPILDY